MKAVSLITLQFIHIQYSTLPTKFYSVFSLINTNCTSPLHGDGTFLRCTLPVSAGESRGLNGLLPVWLPPKQSLFGGIFFPAATVNKTCRVAGCQRTSCCSAQLSEWRCQHQGFAPVLALGSFRAARGRACSHPGRPLASRRKGIGAPKHKDADRCLQHDIHADRNVGWMHEWGVLKFRKVPFYVFRCSSVSKLWPLMFPFQMLKYFASSVISQFWFLSTDCLHV